MPTVIDLDDVLGNIRNSTAHRYDAKDSAGNRMDCAKIIQSPGRGYLAVYHFGDTVALATSSDLLHWTFEVVLDPQATQPTIASLPAGGFVTAVEFNDQRGSGGRLRLRHYRSPGALIAGDFDREANLPRTLSRCNEGTPSLDAIRVGSSPDDSVLRLGLHYHRDCVVDRQAVGILCGFSDWSTSAATDLDDALIAAAAADGHRVRGNIGDRDSAVIGAAAVSLFEVQYRRNDFGSWRIYLRDNSSGVTQRLPVITHGGSTAFANPTLTVLTAPNGRDAVVVTLFVPTEGAAPGEAGELIHYREL